MTVRGLTMLEMLLALVLLSVLVAASAAWLSLAGHMGLASVEPLQCERVMNATLALIHDDLAKGDFFPQSESSERSADEQPRVWVVDGALEIRSRSGHTMVYRLDRNAHVLERTDRSASGATTRRIADRVEEFECAIDEKAELLRVTIMLSPPEKRSFSRRYLFP